MKSEKLHAHMVSQLLNLLRLEAFIHSFDTKSPLIFAF